ncbi:MAG TPA: hypothetical protein VKD22_17970 [Ramlibacter sp.]|nr:hypothetical protein [Ramlibacter sp.]
MADLEQARALCARYKEYADGVECFRKQFIESRRMQDPSAVVLMALNAVWFAVAVCVILAAGLRALASDGLMLLLFAGLLGGGATVAAVVYITSAVDAGPSSRAPTLPLPPDSPCPVGRPFRFRDLENIKDVTAGVFMHWPAGVVSLTDEGRVPVTKLTKGEKQSCRVPMSLGKSELALEEPADKMVKFVKTGGVLCLQPTTDLF